MLPPRPHLQLQIVCVRQTETLLAPLHCRTMPHGASPLLHVASSCLPFAMGWLRLVGSLKLYVSFAESDLFYRALLQKRPIVLRSLLIVATPYALPHQPSQPLFLAPKCVYVRETESLLAFRC